MGFGYLLLGYLITFVLYTFFATLGIGGVALLLGEGMMLYGLVSLCRYHRGFCYAKWLTLPMLALGAYDAVRSLNDLLLWRLPLFEGIGKTVADWIMFALLILFNLAVLSAVRAMTRELGLLSMAASATRNLILVSTYGLLYLIAQMPFAFMNTVKGYLLLPINLLNILWVACNLLLLLSCNKNICPAGDEEQPPRRTRFAFLNRLNEAYERNRQSAVDRITQETEDKLRARKARREQKKKDKKER